MNLQLENKTALVTGSTAGICFAIARSLAAEGAHVVVNGRTQARVDAAISKIRESQPATRLTGHALDLGSADGCEEMIRRLPKVDILVNNLGILEPKEFAEIPDEDWSRLFEVNVFSGVRLSRAYLPGMKSRDWGRIIFKRCLNSPGRGGISPRHRGRSDRWSARNPAGSGAAFPQSGEE